MISPAETFLIDEIKTSINDVLESLVKHKNDTEWSARTTHFAIEHITGFKKEYKKDCKKGFLSENAFFDILLPLHGHMEDLATGIVLFPSDVTINKALECYKNPDPKYTKECSNQILLLKDQIRENGFTSEIIIELVDGNLRHIDGLHRMIALGLLLEEGYKYKPVPVYLLIR